MTEQELTIELDELKRKFTSHIHNKVDNNQVNYNDIKNTPNLPIYYDKVTTTNASTTVGFTNLPLHDEWILRFNIYNSAITERVDPKVQLNGITSNTNYASFVASSGGGYSFYNTGVYGGWLTISMVADHYVNILGEMHITGKHHNGEKGMWARFTRSGALTDISGQEGQMTGDSADVSRIDITFGGLATGQIELYYRDNA